MKIPDASYEICNKLIKELSMTQRAVMFSIQLFIGYDNIVRGGNFSRGKPLSMKEISSLTYIPYSTLCEQIKLLRKLGVIYYGNYNDYKKVLIVNPFIYTNISYRYINIYKIFEDTKYRYMTKYDNDRLSYDYARWKYDVFCKDSFICQNCGNNKNLEAHHIYPYSEFPDKRFEVSNGMTLCTICHSPKFEGSFHNIYGTRNNNKEQLEEYIGKQLII